MIKGVCKHKQLLSKQFTDCGNHGYAQVSRLKEDRER